LRHHSFTGDAPDSSAARILFFSAAPALVDADSEPCGAEAVGTAAVVVRSAECADGVVSPLVA
jgi:hypothetical protein